MCRKRNADDRRISKNIAQCKANGKEILATNTAVNVLNRTGTSTVVGKTPYELWHNKEVKIDHLRIFGSEVFIHIPREKRKKLDPKASKCIFVGYDNHSKGYRVWNPKSSKIEISRDVIFLVEEPMATIDIEAHGGLMQTRATMMMR